MGLFYISKDNLISIFNIVEYKIIKKQKEAPGGNLPLFSNIINVTPLYPPRNLKIIEPEISSGTSIIILNKKNDKILYQKNINEKRSIASLTKLMTALIVVDDIDLEKKTIMSQQAVDTEGVMGGFKNGEQVTIKTLLYALLMQSSNDAAIALAEKFNSTFPNSDFIEEMNKTAQKLGMEDTLFADPSGLDPNNLSTATNLTKLISAVINKPILKEILKTPFIEIPVIGENRMHKYYNTDALLKTFPEITGGKTGYTIEAGECMILAIQYKSNEIIYVLLGAEYGQRFPELERLIKWTKEAYVW